MNDKMKVKQLAWRKEQKSTGVKCKRLSGRHNYTKDEWRDAPRSPATPLAKAQ